MPAGIDRGFTPGRAVAFLQSFTCIGAGEDAQPETTLADPNANPNATTATFVRACQLLGIGRCFQLDILRGFQAKVAPGLQAAASHPQITSTALRTRGLYTQVTPGIDIASLTDLLLLYLLGLDFWVPKDKLIPKN